MPFKPKKRRSLKVINLYKQTVWENMWRMDRIISNPILLILLIYFTIFSVAHSCTAESEFVPTHQWQKVPKGRAIPKGLHVRINLETGETEAKLLDEEPYQRTDLSLSEIPPNEESNRLLETDVVKEALMKIKGDDMTSKESNIDNNKFRTYEQLKDDMSSLNLTAKIDAEIMNELFTQHNEEISKKEVDIGTIARLLEDLDFLAHQFDNGLEFVRLNGFNKILYKDFNSSNGNIKQNAFKLFGSLVQNNGRVQIHALETGSIPIILRILNLETDNQVKSRAIFALSCLLRRFPLSQLHFIENGGLSVVVKLMRDGPIKIQIKLVTLMNDLLLENMHAVEDTPVKKKQVDQYKLVNLENLLLENNWCSYLNELLVSVLATEPRNHDSVEKCIVSMKTLTKQCNSQFSEDILIRLIKTYKILADTKKILSEYNDGEDFFINIHDLCADILHSKNIKNEL